MDEALLAAKLRLEDSLVEPLMRACAAYLTQATADDATPSFITNYTHVVTVQRLLEQHYARVVSMTLGADITSAVDDVAHILNVRFAEQLRARAQSRARHIIATLDRDLSLGQISAGKSDDDDIEVKEASDPKPFTISWTARLREGLGRAWSKLKSKIGTVVNAETEEISEGAQFEWVKQQYANAQIVKTWSTMQDERVRHSHNAAEGQEVPVDQPFTLAGGQLMFPGDTSLGVSMGEVYNCRCSASYTVITQDGQRIPIGLETPRLPATRPWRRGDRFGQETPISPTTLVTLNGTTRAKIVLGDGTTIANLREVTPGLINVTTGRRTIARATHANGQVTTVTISPGFERQGIEDLIRRSVRHSAGRKS